MSPTAIPVAFLAGLVSFLAPCVLPLVPGYLSTVSAVDADRLGQPGNARRVVVASVPFVLGFTTFFVLLGAGAALVGGRLLADQFLLERIAGFILIVFGLAFMGLLPWPSGSSAPVSSQGADRRGSRFLLGGAFAVCAAPCIGPVLAARSSSSRASRAPSRRRGAALAVYSLGLAVPFLLAAAVFVPAMGAFRWLRDHYVAIQVVGGAILVALGALLFFERF